MGLKKENYEIKELGLTLPAAYAIIHRLEIDGNNGIAEIYIQSSPRENAVTLKPLKREFIRFKVDRNENPFITAYKEAKKITIQTVVNKDGEEEKVEFKAPFADWTDDIVQEK